MMLEVAIEKSLKFLLKYKKGKSPTTQAEILEVANAMEVLNGYLYELKRKKR